MFRAELDMFAESCRSGKGNELSADNGNVALAVVYAALRSIERERARQSRSPMSSTTARRHAGGKEPQCCLAAIFSDLTQPEIAAQLKKNPLVILPAGSVEQHGPHLPTGTDTLAANVIAHARGRAHGRSGAAGHAARRHADAHAVRRHDHAHARHLHARRDRDLRLDRQARRQISHDR